MDEGKVSGRRVAAIADSADETARAFWRNRALTACQKLSARFHQAHTPIDRTWLSGYVGSGSLVLDLGCGTCEVANWLVHDRGAFVHAVEREGSFLQYATKHERMNTSVVDIVDFNFDKQYDVCLMLGVLNFVFDENRRLALYEKIAANLAPEGFLLIKSQFGIDGPFTFNGFSAALNSPYAALYPGIVEEQNLLQRYFVTETYSLYPPELNPHLNTKFYHIAARSIRAR